MRNEGVEGGREVAGNGREGVEEKGDERWGEEGGICERIKFEKLKRKEKIDGIRWVMGD